MGEIRKCSVLISVMMGVGGETQTCVSTRECFSPRFIERHLGRIKHHRAVGSLGDGRSWELEESSCAQRGETGGITAPQGHAAEFRRQSPADSD